MPKVDLSKTFTKAVTASKQEIRISELQLEIDELRAQQSPELEEQLDELRKQLKKQSGEQFIPLSEIRPNQNQPRRSFSEESIASLARSLERDGQITPIIVIPQEKGFLLWDGERRFRSAEFLNWEKIKAVFAPMPPDLHRKAFLTFIHHEDLNALDKAEAIIHEITIATGKDVEAIPTGIRSLVRRLERNNEMIRVKKILNESRELQIATLDSLDISSEQKSILSVLLDLQMNPASIASNDLQMLSLHDDIKSSIRRDGLKGAHALILQKLSSEILGVPERKAKNIRLKAIEQVLKENLNVPKTRNLVQSLINENIGQEKQDVKYKKMERLMQGIEKFDFDDLELKQLEEFRDYLKLKLAEIESSIKK